VSKNAFAAIVSANAEYARCPNCDQVAAHVVGQTTELSKPVVLQIVDTVASLQTMALAYESLDHFFKSLQEALQQVEELNSAAQQQLLMERLETLLKARGAIEVIAKARDVLTDNQRVFLGTRILTDLRPVFGAESLDEPAGAVILHNLKVVFSEDLTEKEFFVTLDELDLERLSNVIIRARNKAKALKHAWHKTGIPVVDVDTEK